MYMYMYIYIHMYIWLSTDPLGGDSDFASIPSITGTKPDVFSVFADFRGRLSLSLYPLVMTTVT